MKKTKNPVGRPSRFEMEARNLLGIAKTIADSAPTKLKERKRSMNLLIRFTPDNGYDEVYPLLLAIKRAGRGAQTKFVRQSLIKAVKEAKSKKA